MNATASRFGTVIDAQSGKGVANATVIVAATIFSGTWFNPGQPVYRVITHTDDDGNYVVPNTFLPALLSFPVGLPFQNSHINWYVTVFKPGYGLEDDKASWTTFLENGQPRFYPNSVVKIPTTTWLGTSSRVETLRLLPLPNDTRVEAIYYSYIFRAGIPYTSDLMSPSEMQLRSEASRIFIPRVCSMPPDATIDVSSIHAFSIFSKYMTRFDDSLRALEPKGFTGVDEKHAFHAKNVCTAMSAGESSK